SPMKDTIQENQVVNRLIQWAEKQMPVRAMLLTSSRANENAEIDILSDYDVILYVADSSMFVAQDTWLQDFGSVLVLFRDQEESYGMQEYARLVLYEEGTKIDFTIAPVGILRKIVEEPRLPSYLDIGYKVLVDK